VELHERFPSTPASPALVRELVRESLAGAEPGVLEDVLVMASELAANAVMHARSPFFVHLHADATRIWLGVEDANTRMPRFAPVAQDSTGGRGLALVEALATSWGADRELGGKLVWFEVVLAPAGPRPAPVAGGSRRPRRVAGSERSTR